VHAGGIEFWMRGRAFVGKKFLEFCGLCNNNRTATLFFACLAFTPQTQKE
jgi:hypothetical protein